MRRQLRGYRDQDSPTRRQCCLPLSVFSHLSKTADTPTKKAISELVNGALIFAMRSCEYSTVEGNNNEVFRKTKLLRIRNIRFFDGTTELTRNHDQLSTLATSVQATFEFQKNRSKFESVAMTKNNGPMCPVNVWTIIVKRILSYPRGNTDSPVNLLRIGRHYRQITSTEIRNSLRKTVSTLGETEIGISCDDIGTHSIRSTFAMLLHTHGIDKTTIMKLGRWRSDAVICYIRDNVAGFGRNASAAFRNDPGNNFANFPAFAAPPNRKPPTTDTTEQTPTTTSIDQHASPLETKPQRSRYNLRKRF